MKRIAVLGLISFMSLILSGCGAEPLPPQIAKVKQKSVIETPLQPTVLNPKDWCTPVESLCIIGIATYNFVVGAEYGAKYDVNVKAHQ